MKREPCPHDIECGTETTTICGIHQVVVDRNTYDARDALLREALEGWQHCRMCQSCGDGPCCDTCPSESVIAKLSAELERKP